MNDPIGIDYRNNLKYDIIFETLNSPILTQHKVNHTLNNEAGSDFTGMQYGQYPHDFFVWS
jgi:hypothetical protein